MLSSPVIETQSNLLPTKLGGGGATLAIDNLPGQRIFRAAQANSLSLSGSNVLSWRDQLGGELPLVPNGSTYSATGGPNNGPYVTKGSGLGFGVLPFTQTPFAIYAVVKTPTATVGSPLLTFGFNAGQTGPYYPDTQRGQIYTGVDPNYSVSLLTQPRTTWQLVAIRQKNTHTLEWSCNDEPGYPWQQSGAGSAYPISALSLFMADIQCAELRVLPYYASDADHQAIRTQLVSQYSLSDLPKSTMLIGDSHLAGVQSGTVTNNPFWKNLRANNIPIGPVYLPGACANNNNGIGDFPDVVDSYALAKWSSWKVFIGYGTNDCQTASEASNWTSWPNWKAGYKANIQKFITAGFPAANICLITPPNCTNPALAGNLTTVVNLILEIAAELGTGVINWYQLMVDNSLDAYTHSGSDGLHGNDAMHALLTAPALAFINEQRLLDYLSVMPVAAWSTRKLKSTATNCVRIGGVDVGFAASGKVDATSGTVQRWYDQVGSGYFSASSGVQALSEDTVTGHLQITGDGAGGMETNTPIDLSGSTAATVVVAIRNNQRATVEVLLEQGSPISGGVSILTNDVTSNTLGNGYGSSGGYILNNTPVLQNTIKSYGFISIFEPGAATGDDRAKIRLDGADIDETEAATSGTPNTTGFINDEFYLFGRSASSLFSAASVGAVLIFNQKLGADDLAKVELWLATNWSDSATVPSSLDNSMTPIDRSGYMEMSALGSIKFTTSATKIGVRAYETVANATFAKIGVYLDGAYDSQIAYGSSASIQEQTAILPAGRKTLTLISGLTSDLGRNLTPAGTFLQSVRANAALSRQSVSSTGTLLAIGDSLTVGGNADPYTRDGWLMKLRNAASYPVACHAMGFGNIEDYAGDSTKRTALLVKLAQYNPSNFLIALGTNDYQFGTWSAASFGTAYAALLDAIHAAYASATIYCVTPPTLTTESANAQGSTAGNYRTQISTAVSTRTAFATLIDGTAICSSADLVDGVHGNSTWHNSYFTGVSAAVGL